MTVSSFIKKWNRRFIDYDKTFGNQCVDLIKQFEHENKWPITHGNAKDYAQNAGKDYVWIKNKLTNKPKEGDFIVWNYKPYGHIALVRSATVLAIKIFEQNAPLKSPCHLSTRTFIKCLGWLRKRS